MQRTQGAACARSSIVLFGHPSQVEHIVASNEHLAEVAGELAVDPLLRARQLWCRGAWVTVKGEAASRADLPGRRMPARAAVQRDGGLATCRFMYESTETR